MGVRTVLSTEHALESTEGITPVPNIGIVSH